MKKPTFAVLGMGNRGTAYASKQLKFPDEMEVVAMADTRRVRLDAANKYLNLPVVPKSVRYAQSRRSGKPPLCKGRCPVRTLGGGAVLIVTILQSACSGMRFFAIKNGENPGFV